MSARKGKRLFLLKCIIMEHQINIYSDMPTICWKIFPAKTKKMLSPGDSSVTMRSSFKSVPSQNTKICVYYRYFFVNEGLPYKSLRAQVQGLKESRLTTRDDDDLSPLKRTSLDKARHIPSTALFVRVQCFRKYLLCCQHDQCQGV